MSKTVEGNSGVHDTRNSISEEASGIAYDSEVSASSHFALAERWTNFHLWLGIPTAIMAALASASALSQFDLGNIIAALLAIMVTALTAVATFLNPSEKAYSNTKAGNKHLSIKEDARILAFIDCFQMKNDVKELTDQVKELTKRRSELIENSPLIPSWAHKKGKKRVSDMHASDESMNANSKNRTN